MEIHQTAAAGTVLKFSDAVIAINASAKKKAISAFAVLLCTYPIPVPGWLDSIEAGEGQQVFCGPGEYEKDGLYIRGIGTETLLQGKEMQTTSWYVDADGVRILILGDVDNQKVLLQAITDLGAIDVLLSFCVKGKDTRLNAVAIAAIGAATEAQRILLVGDDAALKGRVVKELGDVEEVVGKYALKKKDLLDGKSKVVLFA